MFKVTVVLWWFPFIVFLYNWIIWFSSWIRCSLNLHSSQPTSLLFIFTLGDFSLVRQGSRLSKSREKHKNWGSHVCVQAACNPVLLKQRQKSPQRSSLSRPAPSKSSKFNNRPCLNMQDDKKITGRTDVNIGWTHMCFYTYVNIGIHMHININIQKGKGCLADLCYMSFVRILMNMEAILLHVYISKIIKNSQGVLYAINNLTHSCFVYSWVLPFVLLRQLII